jgi:hypothetical protein
MAKIPPDSEERPKPSLPPQSHASVPRTKPLPSNVFVVPMVPLNPPRPIKKAPDKTSET